MRLDEFIEDFERDQAAEKRRLAEEKSYAITDHLDDVERQFEQAVQGDSLFGSTAPEIFVGRSGYPDVSTGLLSPVDRDAAAETFATSGDWYDAGFDIEDVLQRRTGLLNSTRQTAVDSVQSGRGNDAGGAHDVWNGFVGVQREVAIADHPVDVEVGLDGTPEIDLQFDDVGTPTGPRAQATGADLAENPHVPRPVEKTLSDDDWQAEGAMAYLYRRGFDVYDINTILSAGALGRASERSLVPTRWSITAVDDTVGQYVRGTLRNSDTIDKPEVWYNEYIGNRYWVVLAPGRWEFELVEMKAPESVWNPGTGGYYLASAHEGYEGRTGYVDETAGAYYAARLGVLEHLKERGRQAKCLVLREITDDYWAPVGVWQVREGVRNAFDGDPGVGQTFHETLSAVSDQLPVSVGALRRKSELVAGLQSQLSDF
ncbi:DNA repair protein NreA [Haloarcula litorea]|uniref:DNA repair protein NreA n=1 Tax=Haloarcula litorea TaxID=3032579 RepID=UPI0023E83455|nr:DNA repair protein NreA [Halomicroarcula sp. GDY20]